MILLADSGSTKTQWCYISKNGCDNLVNTTGINPFFMSAEEIITSIRPVSAGLNTSEIKAIYFFGAGCKDQSKKQKVGGALNQVFGCNNITVDTDMIAACLALCGNKEGIVSIIGTGSNSCCWDGEKIIRQHPSLGYILGDEGGAVSIGKNLVADFLKNQMPADLQIKFSELYDVSVEIVLERVYQMQMPNQYLAGFAPFINNNLDHPYCNNLIRFHLNRFIQRNLLQYPNAKTVGINFTGSVAWHYKDLLSELCKEKGLRTENIVKEPIIGLKKFFLTNFLQ